MARKLKGAVCGCGMISEFHLRGWSRISDVEIVALCDLALDRASDRRRQFAPEARVYAALEEMFSAEALDFIDILTTPSLHGKHCRLAKQADLHIICQKPLCDDLAAARDLVREMADYGKIFAVHENHRYRPWFQTLRERFRQGAFGAPTLLRIEHLSAAEPAEPYKNEAVAGILLEYGTHLIDMMRSLLGEPSRVYTRLHHLNPRVRGESLVHAVYEYPECTASISMAWKRSAMAQSSFLLVGNAGEASYEGSLTRGDSGRLRIAEEDRIVLDEPRCPYDEYVESFYLFERECADAMLGWGQIAQTGEENLKTLACTFAAYESAAAARARGDRMKELEELIGIAASLYARGYTFGTAGNMSVRVRDRVFIAPQNSSFCNLRPQPGTGGVVYLHSCHAAAISCLEELNLAEAMPVAVLRHAIALSAGQTLS